VQTIKLAFTLLSVSHCDCYSDCSDCQKNIHWQCDRGRLARRRKNSGARIQKRNLFGIMPWQLIVQHVGEYTDAMCEVTE